MGNYVNTSILNANKYLTNDKRKDAFLYNKCTIEQKVDGIKVQLLKISDTGNNFKDLVVSYKGDIIYPTEYEYASLQRVKLDSINNSQFKILFNHIKNLDLSKIPVGMVFFAEFASKRPTLSSNYTKHGLVLLSCNKTSFKIGGGKVKVSNTDFNIEGREKYAKILKISVPKVVFEGQLALFERGIRDKELQNAYNKIKNTLNIENVDLYIQKITELFLGLESQFGGLEEGVAIRFENGTTLKLQQSYQTDQTARAAIKMKYKNDDPVKEQEYWDAIRYNALELVSKLPQATERNISAVLEVLGKKLKYLKLKITHDKKTELQIQDDIQTTAKDIILRKMKGNNGCLFLGKFRILTIAHYNIIKYGLKNFDTTTVCLVSNKDTKAIDSLRLEMLRRAFGDSIEIIQHSSGHIFSIINKSQNNINAILCGTDRYADYVSQTRSNPNISVVETPRTGADISATKVIENIDNYAYFCMKTPKEIHPMYETIRKAFKNEIQ